MPPLYPIEVEHPGQVNDLFPWAKMVADKIRDHIRESGGNSMGVTSGFIQSVMLESFNGNAAALAQARKYVTVKEMSDVG